MKVIQTVHRIVFGETTVDTKQEERDLRQEERVCMFRVRTSTQNKTCKSVEKSKEKGSESLCTPLLALDWEFTRRSTMFDFSVVKPSRPDKVEPFAALHRRFRDSAVNSASIRFVAIDHRPK